MSTQKITSSAGTTDFPFNNLDQLIAEEQALPPIPDFPSIWSTANTSNGKQATPPTQQQAFTGTEIP